MARQALIVFVKSPIPGQVKTRLTPELTSEEAAELYSAFIKDSFDRYKTINNTDLIYYYFPEDGLSSLQKILPNQQKWALQRAGDLGMKMHFALNDTLKSYKKVVIVGSDHPDLPIPYLKKAFDVLDYVDVCIGPSDDGGYYCIGLKKANISLFKGMIWSVDTVYAETLNRIKSQNLEHVELPNWYDVDTIKDLQKFLTSNELNLYKESEKLLRKLIPKILKFVQL